MRLLISRLRVRVPGRAIFLLIYHLRNMLPAPECSFAITCDFLVSLVIAKAIKLSDSKRYNTNHNLDSIVVSSVVLYLYCFLSYTTMTLHKTSFHMYTIISHNARI